MSLAGCQINPTDINFHLQKSLKFLIKTQMTKSDLKKQGSGKCPPSSQLGLRPSKLRQVFRAWYKSVSLPLPFSKKKKELKTAFISWLVKKDSWKMEINFQDLYSLYFSQICTFLVYSGPISGSRCNSTLHLSKCRRRVEVVPLVTLNTLKHCRHLATE